ncbi:MAG: ATP-binding protein, partial [bacterium]|nr:ATP-binding protein [bacterium]
MYELFRFINSANIPYAKIDLDGNIHIEGRNGTGKSTILRAILFFYNSSSRKLGIAEHQNKFVDFYLPYENSYILFEVGKEQATYLVVLFRSKNRPCFRIINSAYDQSLFLDESKQARFPNQMPSIIAAKNLDPPTRIIDKHEEFRNIIYGIPSDKTHRQYSLFETKSYENIPRAITNIFLNYKLESDFIKQSVVHSLVDPDDERYKIDVKILKKPLEDFQGNLEDIEVYQRNETTANKIIQLYDTIINIEIDKKLLAQKLGGSIKWANVEKNNLQKMLQLLEMEIEKLSDRLKYNENQYQQEQRLLNDKISVLNHQIQLAKNKQKEYQTINIESIIQNVNNK